MVPFAGVPKPDVLRRVVVRVQCIPTRTAPKLGAVAVVFVRESTLRTPSAGVIRFDSFDRDTTFRCFVLDVLEQPPEGPDVVPVRERRAFADVVEFFEHDNVAVGLYSFGHDFVRRGVEILLAPRSFPLSETSHRAVGVLSRHHETASRLERFLKEGGSALCFS